MSTSNFTWINFGPKAVNQINLVVGDHPVRLLACDGDYCEESIGGGICDWYQLDGYRAHSVANVTLLKDPSYRNSHFAIQETAYYQPGWDSCPR